MIDEPSVHRLKSVQYRGIGLDNESMDRLHHLIFEADTIEVDFEEVEDPKQIYKALSLMGKAKFQGEMNA